MESQNITTSAHQDDQDVHQNKNEFVKQTLAGLMFSGLHHAPFGPVGKKEYQKEKIWLLYEAHHLV